MKNELSPIKRYRINRGLTYPEAEKLLNSSTSSIIRYEKDCRTMPLHMLNKMSKVFKLKDKEVLKIVKDAK